MLFLYKTAAANRFHRVPQRYGLTAAVAAAASLFSASALADKPEVVAQCLQQKLCTCRDLGGDYEKGFTWRCAFKDSDIEKTYQFFRRANQTEIEFLAATLPRKNQKSTRNAVESSYQWKGTAQLDVALEYEGGGTRYRFTQKGKTTELNLHFVPY